jgi:hypothetical protein
MRTVTWLTALMLRLEWPLPMGNMIIMILMQCVEVGAVVVSMDIQMTVPLHSLH